jgi:hypothetical protein
MSTRATTINLHAVYTRTDSARRVVGGLAAVNPTLAEIWQQLDRMLDDVAALGATVAWLTAELAGTRLDRASLLAAIRATIEADADGEADPLAYLRNELTDREARRG